jgi:hypothetical protein
VKWRDNVIGRNKAIGILAVVAATSCWLTIPAHAQGFSKMKGDGPPVEKHPKVDEKAYKAALDRIPEPRAKYDPWGVARSAQPAGVAGRSN